MAPDAPGFSGQEEIGLEHSITNETIARHYLEAKAFDRARPYADAAVQSGSEASMRLACECYEGLKQWDVAERFVRIRWNVISAAEMDDLVQANRAW